MLLFFRCSIALKPDACENNFGFHSNPPREKQEKTKRRRRSVFCYNFSLRINYIISHYTVGVFFFFFALISHWNEMMPVLKRNKSFPFCYLCLQIECAQNVFAARSLWKWSIYIFPQQHCKQTNNIGDCLLQQCIKSQWDFQCYVTRLKIEKQNCLRCSKQNTVDWTHSNCETIKRFVWCVQNTNTSQKPHEEFAIVTVYLLMGNCLRVDFAYNFLIMWCSCVYFGEHFERKYLCRLVAN